ncbi:aldose 1-epimerase family protein [Rudanella lutea]|uniref:aldose 1-epimerase family protein n=1 Tax=Rudanella lutea TaxID=451374 RepID=UPI00037D5177|nr:aldose 1-epimerase family protein [Rudanella lutea]
MTRPLWTDKISHPAQLGGIETSILDNGPGRGSRIAWINTGTGLRFKMVLDRSMDIVEAFYNEHSLAWLSHGGITTPEPAINHGIDWLRTFPGGLLTTCGLSNVGGPNEDAHGQRGLHGRISNLPAELESVVQPDPVLGHMGWSISGRMRESQVFGPTLELKRTVSGELGKAVIYLEDTVINRGNTPAPHMLLYHLNFGWPLVDEGTRILAKGNWQARPDDMSRALFNPDNDYQTCPPPLDTHSGTGEGAAFINPTPNAEGQCTTGLYNPRLGLAVAVQFEKEQLPWLTNWQHWGKGEYVTGLEPGTHPPIGQAQAREEGTLIFLEPGAQKNYRLKIEILTDQVAIEPWLALNG